MSKTQKELNEIKNEYQSFTSKAKELSDDELKEITGGSYYDNEYHANKADASYLFNVNEEVEVYSGWLFGTVRCKIVDRRIVWYETHNTGAPGIPACNISGYRDEYKVQELKDHWYFYLNDEWIPRNDIERR